MTDFLHDLVGKQQERAADRGNDTGQQDDAAASTHTNEEPTEPAGQALETPEPKYGDAAEFMVEFVGPIISRKISQSGGAGLRWDKNWFQYPEAVFRADLMWRTFEAARADKDPSALETWTRQVLDYHLGVLMNGERGPMYDNSGPQDMIGAHFPPEHPKAEAHREKLEAREATKQYKRKQRRAAHEREQYEGNDT